jgi:cell shape-determining protein MreC
VDLISSETPVAKGDIFGTSGLQRSVFPPGIPVGSVRTAKPGAIQKEITMIPLVDLQHLEFVKILLTKDTTKSSAP